jgi:hypothetical protein
MVARLVFNAIIRKIKYFCAPIRSARGMGVVQFSVSDGVVHHASITKYQRHNISGVTC